MVVDMNIEGEEMKGAFLLPLPTIPIETVEFASVSLHLSDFIVGRRQLHVQSTS